MALTLEQLEQRRGYICGSDTPKVFGVCEFPDSTPLDLWYDKKGIKLADVSGPDPQRGNLLEPLAISQFQLIKQNTCTAPALFPVCGRFGNE